MKFRKFMTAVTLTGIFLTGIGAGIGFVEFCDFEYQGNVVMGEENREEARLVWELGDGKFASLHSYVPYETEDITVQKETKVPKDEVWFDIVYNSAWGEPYLDSHVEYAPAEYLEESRSDWTEKESDEKLGYADIWMNHSLEAAEEIKIFMKIKDQFLKELKAKKFSTYSSPRIFSVKVRVNPDNYERLNIVGAYGTIKIPD